LVGIVNKTKVCEVPCLGGRT